MPAPEGVLVVDKPAGWTSHDVVARVRRLAGTRRVGHAGTLDPMATGVLVLGLGRATRLLGHLARTDKAYTATIRLGMRTSTDDAQGEVVSTTDASDVDDAAVRAAVAALTGAIEQVPSAVSAVKVAGVRSYVRARAGEPVRLAPRPVLISRFEVLARRGADLDVAVECSSGTYVRALARDLGLALGVGAHLSALRRTRVGPYGLDRARPLDSLPLDSLPFDTALDVLPLAAAAAEVFPTREVTAEQARVVVHGGRLPGAGLGPGPVAVFGPDGALLALVDERGAVAHPLVVFAAPR